MTHTHTDCRDPAGTVVGLIDAIISICRVINRSQLTSPAVREALRDLHGDPDFQAITAAPVPSPYPAQRGIYSF